MKKTLILLPILLVGCGRETRDEPALSGPVPPGAALVSMPSNVSLDSALKLVEREIVLAQRGEGDFGARLQTAEAITDRLIETQMPFAWISSRSYGVEPMLRQIQTLADRIIAEYRSQARPEAIRRDLDDLHELVRGLRLGLRAGGGPHPPTLDSLLARYGADTLAATVATPSGGE